MRPILSGEELRRHIAKCLASAAKSEAIELFGILQLGVGVSGGAEAIIHSSKITFDNKVSAQLDESLLQIDFQNAFDSNKYSRLLKATCEFIPGIAAFTSFCDLKHTPLFSNNAIVQNESVGQQGDPLGPLWSFLSSEFVTEFKKFYLCWTIYITSTILNVHLGILRHCLGKPKPLYCLRTNAPSEEMLEILKNFNDGLSERLDQVVGSIIGKDA